MGRWAISLLTAICVLWHTIAGCCAHHSHAATLNAAPAKAMAETSRIHSGKCCHSHGKRQSARAKTPHGYVDGPKSPSSNESCPCPGSHSCDEASCAFALSKPASLPDSTLDVVAFLVPVADAARRSAYCAAATASNAGQMEIWLPESLRAHLFLLNLRN